MYFHISCNNYFCVYLNEFNPKHFIEFETYSEPLLSCCLQLVNLVNPLGMNMEKCVYDDFMLNLMVNVQFVPKYCKVM